VIVAVEGIGIRHMAREADSVAAIVATAAGVEAQEVVVEVAAAAAVVVVEAGRRSIGVWMIRITGNRMMDRMRSTSGRHLVPSTIDRTLPGLAMLVRRSHAYRFLSTLLGPSFTGAHCLQSC
jgi:DNA-directed RNA polymerase specialized sigma24 family protein